MAQNYWRGGVIRQVNDVSGIDSPREDELGMSSATTNNTNPTINHGR